MIVGRGEPTNSYEEVLERILDHGFMVDPFSRLTALASNSGLCARMVPTAIGTRKNLPTSILCPPRSRDRNP